MTEPVRRVASETGAAPAISPAEFEDFYRHFFLPLVRRAVRRHGLSLEDAGDIVQDTFVLSLGKLDPGRNPKAWLYQVVDHLSANLQRKTCRRAQLLARWEPREPNSESPDSTVSDDS